MNKITHKERTEKNNIVCPNCHINIKVLTDDLFLNMSDEWHDDMYISHEDEYLERKALQERIDKAIDKLKSMLPMCIMPNNMLIHGTEKARIIEETVNILEGKEVEDE